MQLDFIKTNPVSAEFDRAARRREQSAINALRQMQFNDLAENRRAQQDYRQRRAAQFDRGLDLRERQGDERIANQGRSIDLRERQGDERLDMQQQGMDQRERSIGIQQQRADQQGQNIGARQRERRAQMIGRLVHQGNVPMARELNREWNLLPDQIFDDAGAVGRIGSNYRDELSYQSALRSARTERDRVLRDRRNAATMNGMNPRGWTPEMQRQAETELMTTRPDPPLPPHRARQQQPQPAAQPQTPVGGGGNDGEGAGGDDGVVYDGGTGEPDVPVQVAGVIRPTAPPSAPAQGYPPAQPLPQRANPMVQRYDDRPRSGSYVDRTTWAESRDRADAQNPRSSARGVGQFINATWLHLATNNPDRLGVDRDLAARAAQRDPDAVRQVLALRDNPEMARRAVQLYGDMNRAQLQRAGFEPNDVNAGLAHFLGGAGATRFLNIHRNNPDTPVNQAVNAAALRANPEVFIEQGRTGQAPRIRTTGEIVRMFERRYGARQQTGNVDAGAPPIRPLAQRGNIIPAEFAGEEPQSVGPPSLAANQLDGIPIDAVPTVPPDGGAARMQSRVLRERGVSLMPSDAYSRDQGRAELMETLTGQPQAAPPLPQVAPVNPMPADAFSRDQGREELRRTLSGAPRAQPETSVAPTARTPLTSLRGNALAQMDAMRDAIRLVREGRLSRENAVQRMRELGIDENAINGFIRSNPAGGFDAPIRQRR